MYKSTGAWFSCSNPTCHNIVYRSPDAFNTVCGVCWYTDENLTAKRSCDCGTTKAIKDAPLRAHSHWCSYRKSQEGL